MIGKGVERICEGIIIGDVGVFEKEREGLGVLGVMERR